MSRLILIIPLLGLSAFATYYRHWNASYDHGVTVCRKASSTEIEDIYARRDPKRDAENDILRGHPRYLTYGLPVGWLDDYSEVLARDYGVELDVVAGCLVTTSLVNYVEAYNEVLEAHLRAVHGPGVFDKIRADTQARYQERRAAAPESDPRD